MNEWQQKIGVGERSRVSLSQAGTSRRRDVVVQEGPNRGRVGGHHTDHWDGRVDATVLAPVIRRTMKESEQ